MGQMSPRKGMEALLKADIIEIDNSLKQQIMGEISTKGKFKSVASKILLSIEKQKQIVYHIKNQGSSKSEVCVSGGKHNAEQIAVILYASHISGVTKEELRKLKELLYDTGDE